MSALDALNPPDMPKIPDHCMKIGYNLKNNVPIPEELHGEVWTEEKVEECRIAWLKSDCYFYQEGYRDRDQMSTADLHECAAMREEGEL